MDFLRANIDRAIVYTQYDLRGFTYSLGNRIEGTTPKGVYLTTCAFMYLAAGGGDKTIFPTDKRFADYSACSYEEYLAMCQRLFNDCDDTQKEAIQLIIGDIVQKSGDMKKAAQDGTGEQSNYLRPLTKDNEWGRVVLALAEVFEVSLAEVVPVT